LGLASKRIATPQSGPGARRPPTGLEIGTRFKEDCDLGNPEKFRGLRNGVGNWDSLQRGLRRSLSLSLHTNFPVGNWDSLQRGLRLRYWDTRAPPGWVGNWDSLQRGLRQAPDDRDCDGAVELEIGTRFKEDCDPQVIAQPFLNIHVGNWDSLQRGLRRPLCRGLGSSRDKLEIGTRFKEDCDTNSGVSFPLSSWAVGNWDSLQRGLRLSTSCALDS